MTMLQNAAGCRADHDVHCVYAHFGRVHNVFVNEISRAGRNNEHRNGNCQADIKALLADELMKFKSAEA